MSFISFQVFASIFLPNFTIYFIINAVFVLRRLLREKDIQVFLYHPLFLSITLQWSTYFECFASPSQPTTSPCTDTDTATHFMHSVLPVRLSIEEHPRTHDTNKTQRLFYLNQHVFHFCFVRRSFEMHSCLHIPN